MDLINTMIEKLRAIKQYLYHFDTHAVIDKLNQPKVALPTAGAATAAGKIAETMSETFTIAELVSYLSLVVLSMQIIIALPKLWATLKAGGRWVRDVWRSIKNWRWRL